MPHVNILRSHITDFFVYGIYFLSKTAYVRSNKIAFTINEKFQRRAQSVLFCKQTKPDKQKFRFRNCPKLVEGRLFTIIDLLIEAKSITLYFIWREEIIFAKFSN